MVGKGEGIHVGNVTGNTGVAIGHNAQAHVAQGVGGDQLAQLFASVYQRIESRPDDPDVDKEELTDTIQKVEAEAGKGEHANANKVERWLNGLADVAPDVLDVAIAALTSPIAGASVAVQKISERIKEHHEQG
jgi:hypothetical protein